MFLIRNMEITVKKICVFICVSLMIISTCSCTNPFVKNNETQPPNIELIEIQNSDYTFTYKTTDGKIIFNNIPDQLDFADGLAVITENDKYGIVNKLGEKVVEPIYDFISGYQNGLCAFFIQDISQNVKIGYFNTKGEVAIEPKEAEMSLFSGYSYDYNFYNGLALYRNPQNYKFGFIDTTGKLVIDTIYDWAEPFTGKLAPVTKGNKYGYINTSGTLVVPYKFVFAENFSDGLAAVYNGSTWGYIDETRNYVIPSKFGSYEGHDGEEIANPFIDGYAAVYLGKGQALNSDIYKGQFALIDKTGTILNGQKYDYLRAIPNGRNKVRYEVRLNGEDFMLNSIGQRIKEKY